MTYDEAISAAIDEALLAVARDYAGEGESQRQKRAGSEQGLEACRGKSPSELAGLLANARKNSNNAYVEQAYSYWKTRCFEAEVEWVCNFASAVLANQGLPVIVEPTARGMLAAMPIEERVRRIELALYELNADSRLRALEAHHVRY